MCYDVCDSAVPNAGVTQRDDYPTSVTLRLPGAAAMSDHLDNACAAVRDKGLELWRYEKLALITQPAVLRHR